MKIAVSKIKSANLFTWFVLYVIKVIMMTLI
jgi:hypothetical protein